MKLASIAEIKLRVAWCHCEMEKKNSYQSIRIRRATFY